MQKPNPKVYKPDRDIDKQFYDFLDQKDQEIPEYTNSYEDFFRIVVPLMNKLGFQFLYRQHDAFIEVGFWNPHNFLDNIAVHSIKQQSLCYEIPAVGTHAAVECLNTLHKGDGCV